MEMNLAIFVWYHKMGNSEFGRGFAAYKHAAKLFPLNFMIGVVTESEKPQNAFIKCEYFDLCLLLKFIYITFLELDFSI